MRTGRRLFAIYAVRAIRLEPADTNILRDIMPGDASSNIFVFTLVGQKAFFGADDGTNGDELWVTDGTTPGTHIVTDIYP